MPFKNARKYIEVECKNLISNKCFKMHKMKYDCYRANLARNNGNFICKACAKTKLSSLGNNHKNRKYYFDERYFNKIDNEDKAYILGIIASDGNIHKRTISIYSKDLELLEKIKNIICPNLKLYCKNSINVLCLISNDMCKDICAHLKISPGKKSHIVEFPCLEPCLERHFIRGYIDGDGHISNIRKLCKIKSNSFKILESIKAFSLKNGIDCKNEHLGIRWNTKESVEFLDIIYADCKTFMSRKYENYLKWK